MTSPASKIHAANEAWLAGVLTSDEVVGVAYSALEELLEPLAPELAPEVSRRLAELLAARSRGETLFTVGPNLSARSPR